MRQPRAGELTTVYAAVAVYGLCVGVCGFCVGGDVSARHLYYVAIHIKHC